MTADRQVRSARILALVFAFAGFALIVLGWNGMAKVDSVDQQLPYLLSGGFGGMALILLSVALLLIAQIRTERRKLMNVLEVMAVAVGRAVPQAERTDVLSELGSPAATAGPGMVVAGPSTYHRPDCRLVQGKAGLDRMPLEAARRSDLSPCRVCDPDSIEKPTAAIAEAGVSGDREEAPATV